MRAKRELTQIIFLCLVFLALIAIRPATTGELLTAASIDSSMTDLVPNN